MLTETLAKALNYQITHERQNQALYQAIAYTQEGLNWPGVAHWFKTQAAEEGEHAAKFADFLIKLTSPFTDGQAYPDYQALDAPLPVTGPMPAVFQQALDRERMTTAQIQYLYHLAGQEGSPTVQAFLQWFLLEQVEEEAALIDILQELNRATDQASLLLLDQKYAKR